MARLVAILLIPRIDGYHLPCKSINFNGGNLWFRLPDKVEAKFSKGRLGRYKPGVAVHCFLKRSKIDYDFRLPYNVVDFVITQKDLELLQKALDKSDELTAELRQWPGWGGERPFLSQKLAYWIPAPPPNPHEILEKILKREVAPKNA